MKLKNEKQWNEYVAANEDEYGKAIISFARDWAEEMEKGILLNEDGTIAGYRFDVNVSTGIVEPRPIGALARATMKLVDARPGYGITGFMYGAAIKVLSDCWVHGEELRQWHNLDCEIGSEGRAANMKEGAVLNPALLNMEMSK